MKLMILFFALFLFHITGLPGTEKHYQLIDLGLQKYEISDASSINDQGFICGSLVDRGYSYIFVLDPDGKIATRNEDMLSYKIIINNYNEVYGSLVNRTEDGYWEFSQELVYQWQNPFRYFQYFNFHHLGWPKNHRCTAFNFVRNVVWDANDLGQVVVMNKSNFKEVSDELDFDNAIWIYNQGDFHKIENKEFSAGFKINNSSQVLGYFVTGSSMNKNRIYHTSIYDFNNNTVTVLEFPASSVGHDLNDLGQVVGIFFNLQEQQIMGFLYEPSGEIIYLSNFKPKAINNKGQIIGAYIYDEKKDKPAILDESGQLYPLDDLTSLVDDKGNTWDSLDSLTNINNEGLIIGNGTINGKMHSFLLKPI